MGASTTTLQTGINTVRTMLDEPVQASTNFWSDAQLTTYFNMGCSLIQRKAEAIETTSNVTVTVGTQTYTAPTNMLRIYRLEYLPTGGTQVYPIEFRGYNEMDAVWGINQTIQAGNPTNYTLWKNPPAVNIVLYPIPANAGVLKVYFYPDAIPVVLVTDTFDILPQYEDVLYDYVCYRALQQDSNPRWNDYFQLYTNGLTDMIAQTRMFTDQANYFSTGSSNSPVWWLDGGGAGFGYY